MLLDRVILGIDPGTYVLGYGVLHVAGRKVEMVAMGVIDLRHCTDIYLKLGRIYERIVGLIDSFHPDEMAIESPFYAKNIQTMLKLGRAQGVAIAAAICRQVPIHEYAPMKIKMSISGNGAASKEQVAEMMKRLLHLTDDQMLPYLDATDALAAAYCHYTETCRPQLATSQSMTWKDFVKRREGDVRKPLTEPQKKLLQQMRR